MELELMNAPRQAATITIRRTVPLAGRHTKYHIYIMFYVCFAFTRTSFKSYGTLDCCVFIYSHIYPLLLE